MDQRILLAVVVGLILAAFGGFYIALSPRFDETVTPPPASLAVAPTLPAPNAPPATAPAAPAPQQPVAQVLVSPAPATPVPVAPAAPVPPPQATPASIEAEIAMSDYADLQALLKSNFADEYSALIALAVKRRNEGVSEQQFGQEMFERMQDLLRSNLKFGVGASMATIDKLAANEKSLFHALGTDGARYCLKMLGKDDSAADAPPPGDVRRMMGLGTLYRFQAIVEGMPNATSTEALKPEEMKAFETALNAEGLNFKDVSSGAYLNQPGGDPGQPCLTLEKLHKAIATLPEGARRKIYAGMFFLGREK
jgi:hypothetical protein